MTEMDTDPAELRRQVDKTLAEIKEAEEKHGKPDELAERAQAVAGAEESIPLGVGPASERMKALGIGNSASLEMTFNPIQDVIPGKDGKPVLVYTIFFMAKDPDKAKEPPKVKPFLVTSTGELYPLTAGLVVEGRSPKFIPDGSNASLIKIPREAVESFLNGKRATLKEAFQAIKDALLEYMDFDADPRLYDFFSVWILATWLFQAFETFPILFLNGPRECGKTRMGTLIKQMAFNGVDTVDASGASVFRLSGQLKCVLILDEAERMAFGGKNDQNVGQLIEILNATYKKGSEVPRVEKVGKEGVLTTMLYDHYSPKVVMNIAGLGAVTESRCISPVMTKSSSGKTSRNVRLIDERWRKVRETCFLASLSSVSSVMYVYREREMFPYLPSLMSASIPPRETEETADTGKKQAKPADPSAETTETAETRKALLSGRQEELWHPMLSLAFAIDPENWSVLWPVASFAQAQIEAQRGAESADSTETPFLEAIMPHGGAWMTTGEIIAVLKEKDETFMEFNAKSLGRLMKRLGLTLKRRKGREREYFLDRERIRRLCGEYHVSFDPGAKPQVASLNLSVKDALKGAGEAGLTVDAIVRATGLPEVQVEKEMQRLRLVGDAFEPRPGVWKFVP